MELIKSLVIVLVWAVLMLLFHALTVNLTVTGYASDEENRRKAKLFKTICFWVSVVLSFLLGSIA